MINTLWIAGAVVLFLSLVIALYGFKPLPAGGRRCRRCGYDLSATPDDHRRCPECGGSLIGGVVEVSTPGSMIRLRNRLKRVGVFGIGLVIVTAVLLGLMDPRRLPHTPGIWLLGVDVPLAIRSPDEIATPIMREVLRRRDPNATVRIGDRDFKDVARAVMDRFDDENHGGPEARGLVMVAWNEGLITDAEFLSLTWVAPEFELEIEHDPTTETIAYKILGGVGFAAPMGDFNSTARREASFTFELRPRRCRFGDETTWRDTGRTMIGSSVTAQDSMGSLSIGSHIRSTPEDPFPIGETTLQIEVDFQLIVNSNGRLVKADPIPLRLSSPIDVAEPMPTRVSMDVSEDACRRLENDLGTSSWYAVLEESDGPEERGGMVEVNIGLQDTPWTSLGTPEFRIEAELDGETVTRTIEIDRWIQPVNPRMKMKVRFPGARRILRLYARAVLFDLPPFESLSDLRLHVDTRTFDMELWERLTPMIMPGRQLAEVDSIGCEFTIDLPRLESRDVELIMVDPAIEDSILESRTDTVEDPLDRNEP